MNNNLRTLCALILFSAICVFVACAPGVQQIGTPIQATAVPETVVPVTIVIGKTPAPSSNASAQASATSTAATTAATATSVPRGQLSPTELKYRLISSLGTIFFCDPDFYPVARELTPEQIAQRVAIIRQNPEEYNVILKFLGMPLNASLSAAQQAQVYAEHKRLNSIQLQPNGADYQFALRIVDAQKQGFAIEGVIDVSGAITVSKRERTITSCPICLAANTLIDTPDGQIRVQDLRVGMSIWTADASGAPTRGVVVATTARPVPRGVSIIHLKLDDGREIYLSPLHPTFDGRRAAELVVGDILDHARVVTADIVSYQEGATYDILASGETGAYWANGILLRSTLSY